MAEALGVVNVGYIAWLFARSTPWSRTAAMLGAVREVTTRDLSPSATKITTLCCGVCAAAGVPKAAMAPARTSAGRLRTKIMPTLL